MKPNRILALVSVCSITSVVACGGAPDASSGTPPDDPGGVVTSAFSASGSGDVGQGVDTVQQSIKPMYCIQPPAGGKWPEVGTPSSTVSMTLQSDRTQIARSLGIDVSASYGIYSAAASFYRSTESDDLAVSYVFGGSMNFKDVQVGPSYVVDPNLQGKGIVDWYSYCGDSYVQKISRGATLYSAMKFHFSSATERQSFEASFKVSGGLFTASGALKLAQSISKQSVSVDVSAVQVGGDVTQLSRVLQGADAASCSMGSPSACVGFLTSIEGYASGTFPKQFLDASGRPLTGPALDAVTATTGYQTMPWSSLAIPNVPNLAGKPEAKELLGMFEKQFTSQSRIDAINGIPVLERRSNAMALKQRAVTDADGLVIARNVATIQKAWDVCFPDATSECADALATAKADVVEVNAEDLVPWFDALYPKNRKVVDGYDFVDFRNDGHTDLCYQDGSTRMACLVGLGSGGFEQSPSRKFDLYPKVAPYRANAWLKLRGDRDLAYCAPRQLSEPILDCVPIVNGVPTGWLKLVKNENKTVTIQAPQGDTDFSGIDGASVFKQAATIINARDGGWTGGNR